MTDDNMATMPIPDLVAGFRERAKDMDPLLALTIGTIVGRLEREHRAKLRLLSELRHCSVFIRSREKMHPDGIALFDELLEEFKEVERNPRTGNPVGTDTELKK